MEFTKKELKNEIWKDIHNYEGLYQVSNLGRVKSLAREWVNGLGIIIKRIELLLKLVKDKEGYCTVGFSRDGKRKTCKVHRLVLFHFIGESKLECNHKDGNKENNRLENLEYCTPSENAQHAYRIGLKSVKGKRNPMYGKHHSKETRLKISKIIKEIQKGENHPMYGKHHSKESILKMSEAQKGEKHHLYGKHHTEETKQKMSEAQRGEKSNSAKLNNKIVRKIKYTAKYEKVERGYWAELARELNVSYGAIQSIIHNRSWKHIQV